MLESLFLTATPCLRLKSPGWCVLMGPLPSPWPGQTPRTLSGEICVVFCFPRFSAGEAQEGGGSFGNIERDARVHANARLPPALRRRYSASSPPLQVERCVAGGGNAAPVGVVLQPKQSTLQGVTGHFWNSFSLLPARPSPPTLAEGPTVRAEGGKTEPVKLYLTSSSLIGVYYSRFCRGG